MKAMIENNTVFVVIDDKRFNVADIMADRFSCDAEPIRQEMVKDIDKSDDIIRDLREAADNETVIRQIEWLHILKDLYPAGYNQTRYYTSWEEYLDDEESEVYAYYRARVYYDDDQWHIRISHCGVGEGCFWTSDDYECYHEGEVATFILDNRMRDFEGEYEISTKDDVYLAAVFETAVFGWEWYSQDEDCIAKEIAKVLGIDPTYTKTLERESFFDRDRTSWQPLLEAVKTHAKELLEYGFRAHYLFYPHSDTIEKFAEWKTA